MTYCPCHISQGQRGEDIEQFLVRQFPNSHSITIIDSTQRKMCDQNGCSILTDAIVEERFPKSRCETDITVVTDPQGRRRI